MDHGPGDIKRFPESLKLNFPTVLGTVSVVNVINIKKNDINCLFNLTIIWIYFFSVYTNCISSVNNKRAQRQTVSEGVRV